MNSRSVPKRSWQSTLSYVAIAVFCGLLLIALSARMYIRSYLGSAEFKAVMEQELSRGFQSVSPNASVKIEAIRNISATSLRLEGVTAMNSRQDETSLRIDGVLVKVNFFPHILRSRVELRLQILLGRGNSFLAIVIVPARVVFFDFGHVDQVPFSSVHFKFAPSSSVRDLTSHVVRRRTPLDFMIDGKLSMRGRLFAGSSRSLDSLRGDVDVVLKDGSLIFRRLPKTRIRVKDTRLAMVFEQGALTLRDDQVLIQTDRGRANVTARLSLGNYMRSGQLQMTVSDFSAPHFAVLMNRLYGCRLRSRVMRLRWGEPDWGLRC